MAETDDINPETNSESAAATGAAPTAPSSAETLGSATYEIIRQRLNVQGQALRECISKLDARRQEVFGSIEYKLLRADPACLY